MITLYTIHCPACKMLEAKLKKYTDKYEIVDDKETVRKVAEEHHIFGAPFLCVDDKYMNLGEANKWIVHQILTGGKEE